jgi:DhnA family fructose-bisphosphate aldolase class Ia
MHRHFSAYTKRCLAVAVDHGFFNEAAFLPGIEDLPPTIAICCLAFQIQ